VAQQNPSRHRPALFVSLASSLSLSPLAAVHPLRLLASSLSLSPLTAAATHPLRPLACSLFLSPPRRRRRPSPAPDETLSPFCPRGWRSLVVHQVGHRCRQDWGERLRHLQFCIVRSRWSTGRLSRANVGRRLRAGYHGAMTTRGGGT
jgi:hypothetical protein